MEEERYWRAIADAWHAVDGGELCAMLAAAVRVPADVIAERFARFVPVLVARIGELAIDDARGLIDRHRALVRAVARARISELSGAWMDERTDDAIAIVDLFGEPCYRRIMRAPDDADVLASAAELDSWAALARPVHARWRAALLAEIPRAFADVPYPGDADVASGDWPTTEECRYFCGKDWRAIDRTTLHRRYADLSFFSARGRHYLMPAFLMAALEDVDGSRVCGTPIAETLLFQLSYGYLRATIAMMSAAQRDALAGAMRFADERWERGPLAEPDPALADALDALDPSTPHVRRPQRRRR